MRAAWVNLRARSIEQGGSTLTQQLVRSYFLDDRQTLWRKIKEALMAVILEARFDKTDLMNAYINEIYLGPGRRTRDSWLRPCEPVLLRQAARGARAERDRLAGGGRAWTFLSTTRACIRSARAYVATWC